MYTELTANSTLDNLLPSTASGKATAQDGAIDAQWWDNRGEYRPTDAGLVYNSITHRRKKYAYAKGRIIPQNKARTRVYIYQNSISFKPSQASTLENTVADGNYTIPHEVSYPLLVQRLEDENYLYSTIKYNARWRVLSGQHALDLARVDMSTAPHDVSLADAPPKSKRARITTFSHKSRVRLMKKLNQASFIKDGGYFVTLTYPAVYSDDFTVWKKHLDIFLKRVRRLAKQYGAELRYLWKLEFQKRGAPHFHFMFFGLSPSSHAYLMGWVSQAWYEIVASGDEKHLHAGTNVRWMKNAAMVGHYVGKYLAKLGDAIPEYTGRFWGTSSQWEMEHFVLLIKDWQFVKLRRLLSKHLKNKGATRYAKRIKTLRSFFVAGVGYDSDLMVRALANTTKI